MSARSDTQAPRATVHAFLDACERLDLEAAMALLHEDAVYRNVPAPPARGAPAIRQQLGFMCRQFDGFAVEMVSEATDGEVVLTERVDTITVGSFRIAVLVSGTFVVRDGRIVAWRDYFDWASVGARTLIGMPRILWRLLALRSAG